ncbi:MAG TPA: cytochrome d ubiquinol oxidase subunit II, partial [Paenibacillaceae bacterium]|nr:cytochrome d ubiquinol oxidase subunit II [Paenibacillaceae bacterium]
LSPSWKKKWIWILCISSFFIPFLFGVAFSAIFSGLPIDEKGMHLSFFDVINGYSILGGFTYTVLTLLSGCLWTSYKTLGKIQEKAALVAKIVWGAAVLLVFAYFIVFINFTTLFDSLENAPLLWSVPALCVLALLLTIFPLRKKKWLMSFVLASFAIFTLFASGFTGMYPDMLPSYIDPQYSLTLYDAAGSQLNLTVMLWVAGLILPLVITYKIWIYWLLKDKITEKNAQDYQ